MVSLTPRAADLIREWMRSHEAEGLGLRLQVVGGGCSGFLYDLSFTDTREPAD